MRKRIELLVHAGAPSSRKDDDKFKAQAEAYLRFDAGNIANLASVTPEPLPARSQLSQVEDGVPDDVTVVHSPADFLDDTQLAITGLESQLLTSSLPIASGRAVNQSYVKPSQDLSGPEIPSDDRPESASSEAPVTRESLLNQIRSFGKRRREDDDELGARAREEGGVGANLGPAAPVDGPSEQQEVSLEAPSLSSYLKTPILDRTVKKRRLDGEGWKLSHAPRQSYIAASNGSQTGIACIGDRSDSSRVLHAPAATAPAAVARSQGSVPISEPTSELPTSYSLSDITSESSRARVGVSQRSASAPGSIGKAAPSSPTHADASTESGVSINDIPSAGKKARPSTLAPVAPGKQKPEIVVIEDDTQEKAAIAPAPASKATEKTVAHVQNVLTPHNQNHATSINPLNAPSPDLLHTLQTLPTSLHPADPPISLSSFTTHITPALANLANNSDVRDRYKPFSTTRDLRPLERGYWLMDTSPWPLQAQIDFWQFMEQAVGNGSAGWGVWCMRDREEGEGDERASIGLGKIRVYCWGEVVRHVYLLLYVASRSQARKLGMCWIDADGEIVIRMKKA